MRPSSDLRAAFGEIDIYLFDQLLRGRFDGRRSILDAGCGTGRNLVYFLRAGFDVFGLDRDPDAITSTRALAHDLAPRLPGENFQTGELDALPWTDLHVDAVVCSAVLHFARDTGHFDAMLDSMWQTIRPGGLFFARLASVIGLERPITIAPSGTAGGRRQPVKGCATAGRARLPDGSDRFVVTEPFLRDRGARLGGVLLDPVKTTNVQNQRCMTTWVLQKGG